MQNADLLQTFAEVSVAFAGFAGVVSALGRSRLEPRARSFRVRNMIQAALTTLFFSLLPFLVRQLGASELATWRLCSLVFAVSYGFALVYVMREFPTLLREGLLDTRWLAVAISGGGVVVIVALLVNALGWTPELAPGLYLAGLVWSLMRASFHFFMLVLSSGEPPEDQSNEGTR